jgi:RecB family endonuclease NucS
MTIRRKKFPPQNLRTSILLEHHLEDWIADKPEILGETLLIIGRQIIIPEVKDRLDLLALDPNGNAVVIELKRGPMSDPIDMQALRYASYLSNGSLKILKIRQSHT